MTITSIKLQYKIIFLALILLIFMGSAGVNAAPSYIGPNPADSRPAFNQPGSSTDNKMNYIVGKANYIQVLNTYIKIYAPSPNIRVSILGADLCPAAIYVNGTRDVQNAGATNIQPGDQVSTFSLRGHGGSSSLDSTPSYRRSASYCNTNPSTTKVLNAQSSRIQPTANGDLYVFTLEASWDANGVCGSGDCGVNAFRVEARTASGSASRVYVSQQGKDEFVAGEGQGINAASFGLNVGFHQSGDNAPGDQWQNQQGNDFTDFSTEFGASCDVTTPIQSYITIYDDDNDSRPFPNWNGAQSPDRPFLVKLERSPKNQNNWTSVNLNRLGFEYTKYDPNYSYLGQNDWLRIAKGSGKYIDLAFTVQQDVKYRFRVASLDWNNNIQFQLPYPGYLSVESCPEWQLEPETNPPSTSINVGQTHRWTHTITNTGGGVAPSGQAITVAQSRTGFANSIVSTPGLRTPNIISGNTYTVPGTYQYTAQASDVGRTICQSVNVNQFKDNRGSKTSAQKCITVTRPPDRTVKIQPYANNSGETEADNPVSFNGGAVVSDFPNTTDWGYNDQSQQLAAYRVTAVATRGPVDSRTEYTGATGGPYYYCSNGGSTANNCYIPAGYYCFYSQGARAANGCPANTYRYDYPANQGYPIAYYTCPSGYGWTGSGPTCSRTVYRCTETGGNYSPNYPTCRTYYECEGNVANTGWHYSQPLCNRWKCQYQDTPNYDQTNQPTCEYRCNQGRALVSDNPGRAPLATGQYYGDGDRNCYTRPTFTLTCQWTNQAGNQIYSSHASTVTGNGNWCQSTENRPPGNIGDEICISYKANDPGTNNWNTSPRPGIRNGASFQNWGYSVGSPVTSCIKIVGKPYVRVVGGDVAAGIGAGLTAANCPTAAGQAIIDTQNKGAGGGYAGSGASVTALARGTIDDFVSGQFANIRLGNAPTALTFANNSGTFGGNWGSSVACVDASKFTPTSTTFDIGNGNGNYSVNNTQKIKVTNQNVFIGKNISYAGAAWGSLEQIPLYQLMVVGGDIYISGDVSQLDGLYAAVESNGVGGNIYTCASSAGANITQTFTGQCNRQLVVNGSFVAKKVHLTRDCATLNRSSINETTVFSGGGDPQQCTNNGTKASEVFNYLPDQWIRSSIGVPGSSYDAVTTMPPIL